MLHSKKCGARTNTGKRRVGDRQISGVANMSATRVERTPMTKGIRSEMHARLYRALIKSAYPIKITTVRLAASANLRARKTTGDAP
jgi:hypothetical protein